MSIKEELPFPDEDILIHPAHNQEISVDSNYENEDPDEDRSESEENNDAKKEEQSDSTEDDSVDDNRDSKEVDKKFKCQFCPQAYETLHLVRLHLKISHADEDFVQNMFKVEEQYNQTWVRHLVKEKNPAETTDLNVIVCSGQNKKSFKCPLCPNTYATKASVIRHIERNHSTEAESSSDEETTVKSKKEKLIKCPFCPNVYSCNGNVQRHIQKNHSKTENQKCDSNKATDNTIEEESEKVKEPEFKCPFCPQEYFTKRSVGRHVDTNHPEKGVGFHHRNLKKSKSRESNENHPKGPKGSTETVIREKDNKEANPIRFSCSLCPNSYTRNGDLRRHEKDHHNLANKFVCTMCNQRFDSENKLKLHHSAIHSKSNPFKCDQCDKAFKNQGGLLWHLKTHSGPHTPRTTLLSCPVKGCKFQTDRENNLKRHSIVHTNIRAFSCNVCHKKFKSKDHVSRHVEGVHSDVNMFSRVCRAWFVNRVKQMKLEREREILRESVSELRDEEDSNLSDAF